MGTSIRRLHQRRSCVLTEAQVQQSFRKIIATPDLSGEDLDRAEELLDQIRPESPLRHRLGEEIEQLRQLQDAK